MLHYLSHYEAHKLLTNAETHGFVAGAVAVVLELGKDRVGNSRPRLA